MGTYILIGVVILAVIWISTNTKLKDNKSVSSKAQAQYFYSRKDNIMTEAELKFFRRLQTVAAGKYLVFPQIHLSALLKNETKGRHYKAAFQRINRTSVDYILVDSNSLQVAYAVELDDKTHDTEKRKLRDQGVERMLSDAQIRLVRFRNVNQMTDSQIIDKFASTTQP